MQLTSQRLPLTVLLHELSELDEFIIVDVVPELSELVMLDETFELEFTDDDCVELIELLEPPPVPALTVPERDVIVLLAACEPT